jgi:hypothetical protein
MSDPPDPDNHKKQTLSMTFSDVCSRLIRSFYWQIIAPHCLSQSNPCEADHARAGQACPEAALASAQGNEVEPLELLLAASI